MALPKNIPKMSVVLAFVTCAAITGPVRAENVQQNQMRITATVPEICQIDGGPADLMVTDQVVTAHLTESCNSGRQFRVMASHRTLDDDEVVEVTYGDQFSTLARSGLSDIAYGSGARFSRVELSINPARLSQPITISFGITPI